LWKAFSASIEMIKLFLYLFLLMCCITLICICWITPASLGWSQLGHGEWSFWCVVGFSLALFYWGFLHWCSLRRSAYTSPFLMCVFGCIFWFWDELNTGFIKWIRQCSFPFYFMEKFKESWY
jgi:hypothetical protein